MKALVLGAVLAGVAAFGGTAVAQTQAVSQTNGKISAEAGVAGIDGRDDFAGLVTGSLSLPLGTMFGAQLDAGAGTYYGGFTAGGGGHLFWRNPQQALLGLFGNYTTARKAGWGRAGVEGELYLGMFTLAAHGGYQFGDDSRRIDVRKGGFGGGDAIAYIGENFALSAGGGIYASEWGGRAGIEFQPGLSAAPGLSVFALGEIGESDQYKATAGVRFYFGANKSLQKRHREDDPAVFLFSSLGGSAARGKNNGNGGGNNCEQPPQGFNVLVVDECQQPE